MNPFGGNAFVNGFPQQYSSPIGQPAFGQFGNAGFYNSGVAFPANNIPLPNMNGAVIPPRSYSPGPMDNQFGPGGYGGAVFPPRSYSPGPMINQFGPGGIGGAVLPPRSYSPGPMNNQFGPGGFGGAVLPPRSYSPAPMGNQFGPDFGGVVLPPRSYSPGPMGNQFGPDFRGPIPSNVAFNNNPVPFNGIQPPYPNQFGSGTYDRPRSRHRSKSRRRRGSQSSSSSDDEYHRRRSSSSNRNNSQYQNIAPFPHIPPVPPAAGGAYFPPQGPSW